MREFFFGIGNLFLGGFWFKGWIFLCSLYFRVVGTSLNVLALSVDIHRKFSSIWWC
jgi:hypothetical protein